MGRLARDTGLLTFRLTAPLVRFVVRHVPPRGRGMRVVGLHRRLIPTRPGAVVFSRERAGLTLECDLSNGFERVLYFRGCLENDLRAWVEEWLEPGHVVVDVGAHIGSFTALALDRVGSVGEVHAVEASPRTFERLRGSFRRGVPRNVFLHNVAVGSQSGRAAVYAPPGRAECGTLVPAPGYEEVGEITVARLSELLPEPDSIRLLKIDVEGFEPHVLDGSAGLFDDGRVEAVLIELNGPALRSNASSVGQVADRLTALGFDALPHRPGLDPDVEDAIFVRQRSSGVELSVVVPTRGGRERVAAHLPALTCSLGELGVRWEGIVVDDGSSADAAPGRDELPPGWRLVDLGANRGASTARNVGARRARGTWLLFLDDDVELAAAHLRSLWSARSESACVVPEIRGRSGELQNALVRTRKLFEPRWRYEPEPVDEVDYPLGACFLLARTLFDKAGGFDPRFVPNYFEDNAFGEALRRVGSRTLMVRGAQALHLEPRSDGRSRRQRSAVAKNRWRYVFHYTRGRQRAAAIALAPLRVAREAAATRSLGPVVGLGRAVAAELLRGR